MNRPADPFAFKVDCKVLECKEEFKSQYFDGEKWLDIVDKDALYQDIQNGNIIVTLTKDGDNLRFYINGEERVKLPSVGEIRNKLWESMNEVKTTYKIAQELHDWLEGE